MHVLQINQSISRYLPPFRREVDERSRAVVEVEAERPAQVERIAISHRCDLVRERGTRLIRRLLARRVHLLLSTSAPRALPSFCFL